MMSSHVLTDLAAERRARDLARAEAARQARTARRRPGLPVSNALRRAALRVLRSAAAPEPMAVSRWYAR